MSNRAFCIKHARHIIDGTPCPSRGGRANSGANIICDGETMYSYGSHYPLLYAIHRPDGTRVPVVNKTGYGQATSKHIGHAYNALIQLGRDFVSIYESKAPRTRDAFLIACDSRIAMLLRQYDALKRKNTKKARHILDDIARVEADIKKVNQ